MALAPPTATLRSDQSPRGARKESPRRAAGSAVASSVAVPGTVYLTHFERPIGNLANRRAQAQHYLGWAEDVSARQAEHKAGRGARILAACVERGVGFDVVRTWEGVDRHFERRLKNRKNARALCPACTKGAA